MCIFGGEEDLAIQQTRLFARRVGERQLLVYSMHLRAEDRSAMILPIPIAAGTDAIVFRDLSTVPDLFAVLARGFPLARDLEDELLDLDDLSAPPLPVHRVGSFEASFVPTRAGFARVAPRFRLSDDVWRQLPAYDDWGFVVFQFKPGAQDVHPMAFEFPSRFPDWLYFPTVHVHDGRMHASAMFDHQLYLQGLPRVAYRDIVFGQALPDAREFNYCGEASVGPAGTFVSAAAVDAGVVDDHLPLLRLSLSGPLPNEDTWLREPAA
jgi:hypothetical protein